MISPGALVLVDLLLTGSVEGALLTAPPPSPVAGVLYRVAGAGATGVFAGHEGMLAGWSAGGWRFIAPVEGMRLTDRASGVELAFRGGAWTSGSLRANELVVAGTKVVGTRGAAIADATGGSTVDSQARTAIAQILGALRAHGLIAP